ncbi:MAG: hypothetical protein ACO3P1_03735 [Pseudomonadales bacterium]
MRSRQILLAGLAIVVLTRAAWAEEASIGFDQIDHLLPHQVITRAPQPFTLTDEHHHFRGLTYTVSGTTYALDDFLLRAETGGLLVIKGQEILLEYYGPGQNRQSRLTSLSMTRAVIGLLIGSAIQSGQSESGLHAFDPYVPAFNTAEEAPGHAIPASITDRATAIDHPAELLEARVWHAFGMEADATWLTNEPEGTTSGCCLSATLRDFARLGVLAARDGQLPDGTRLVPEGWIAASLHLPDGQVGKGFLSLPGQATPHEHLEIANPQIFVDPDAEFVIALHANPPSGASDYAEHLHAVILALHEAVH